MLLAVLKIDLYVLKCREKHEVCTKVLLQYLNINSHCPLLSEMRKVAAVKS
jgi:hypothetical protein